METNEIVFKLEGTVLFSPAQRCLNGPNGLVVMLTENNLRFLQLLLNGVTEKEQIINQVWKEQRGAVSESSYYGQLYMLRKAFIQVGLKESLIHTIPRKGVRYTGSVSQITVYKEPEKQQDNNDIQQIAILPAPPSDRHPFFTTGECHSTDSSASQQTEFLAKLPLEKIDFITRFFFFLLALISLSISHYYLTRW
ncbi:winged helix-turn-helix domain-containing protein [Yersinia enterocolitica]